MSSIKDENRSLYDYLLPEYNKPFSGWDFSYIEKRRVIEPLGWDYRAEAAAEMRKADFMLDMGTGGGEFLYSLSPLPGHTYATEAYEPNIRIAKEKLGSLGVEVIGIDDDACIPFDSDFFDLVINRHEAYSVSEVSRILRQGGCFITQQVGGANDKDLIKLLGAVESTTFDHWYLDFAVGELEGAGFEILEKHEEFPLVKFYDAGALVYQLKAVPWQIPDFSVEKYIDALAEMHNLIKQKGYIEIKSHRFFIKALKKPLNA